MLGTPLYMAPEQVLTAHSVDHRADLYALGVIMYEMLTTELPGRDPEVPSSLNSDIDPRLDDIILGLLVKDPDERIKSAKSVAKSCHEIYENWKATKPKPSFLKRLFGSQGS